MLLDDFHLAPQSIQAMLLRTLSSGSYRPLGAERDLPVRCRFIFGLRETPDRLLADRTLLPDLRYRLGYCEIRLAPLSERREEIRPLAHCFLKECPSALGVEGPSGFAPDVLPALEAAHWPGNVRELRAVVETAFLHAQGKDRVSFDDLPEHVRIVPRFQPYGDASANETAIEWALWRARGRVDRAARLVGAHRNTVSAHLARRRTGCAHNPAQSIVPGDDQPKGTLAQDR